VYKGKLILYGCGDFINDYDLYEDLLQTTNVRFLLFEAQEITEKAVCRSVFLTIWQKRTLSTVFLAILPTGKHIYEYHEQEKNFRTFFQFL